MATITEHRTYPVERKPAFAYLANPANWPDFYSGILEIADPDGVSYEKPGDTVAFTYSLLGRRLPGTATIDEYLEGELVRHTARVPGLPDVLQTWEYRDAAGGLALEVSMTTEESTSFLGKTIDRLVVPRALQRDVERTLDKLEDVFAQGVPEV